MSVSELSRHAKCLWGVIKLKSSRWVTAAAAKEKSRTVDQAGGFKRLHSQVLSTTRAGFLYKISLNEWTLRICNAGYFWLHRRDLKSLYFTRVLNGRETSGFRAPLCRASIIYEILHPIPHLLYREMKNHFRSYILKENEWDFFRLSILLKNPAIGHPYTI